ncbi:unnamed protein product [Candidula unifasciata]|uniref:Thioredoxin domain-containing protein 12 n=1 Tax=Candidula unifasciata TaxID=100452 RepID=A0A8S3ZVH3_9EUPU|nr:unnamed protein product [Candidula unifasciata]
MNLSRFLTFGISPFFGVLFAGRDLARGWGDNITWLQLQDALQEAQIVQKPMMVIVHKESCPVCARVKPLFASHPGINKLSQHFVMVNLEPDEVPRTPEFEPDGAYVPRILFFSHDGRIFRNIIGKEPRNKYFYDDMRLLENNMKRVLRQYREVQHPSDAAQ